MKNKKIKYLLLVVLFLFLFYFFLLSTPKSRTTMKIIQNDTLTTSSSLSIIQSISKSTSTTLETMLSTQTHSRTIAVCIAGAARSFPEKKVFQSIRDNIVAVWNADVFAAIDLIDHSRKSSIKKYLTYSRIKREDLDIPLAALNITSQHFVLVSGNCTQTINGRVTTFPQNQVGHQIWIQILCYEKIKEEEERRKQKYEWIVRARPDVAYFLPVPPLLEFSNDRIYIENHGSNKRYPGDMFALIPREFADDYFTKRFSKYGCNPPGKLHHERTLVYLFHDSHIPWETNYGIASVVKRAGGDFMCHFYWDRPDLQMCPKLRECFHFANVTPPPTLKCIFS